MQPIEKEFKAFLAQNHDFIKPHLPILLAVQDRLAYLTHIHQQQAQQAKTNRIIRVSSATGQISIYCDQPCQFFDMNFNQYLSRIHEKTKFIFIGSDGVDELLLPFLHEQRKN